MSSQRRSRKTDAPPLTHKSNLQMPTKKTNAIYPGSSPTLILSQLKQLARGPTCHSSKPLRLRSSRTPTSLLPPNSPPIPMASSPSSSREAVMAALLHLPPRGFSDLTRTLAADLRLQRRRLSFLLLSPFHFSGTLAHLHSLSLPENTLLLARLLLHHLHVLFPSLSSGEATAHRLRLRDLDAALLLMAMCDAYDSNHPHADWHARIAEHAVAAALSPAGLGDGGWAVLGHYVDAAAKCRRLYEVVSGDEGKVGVEVAAAAAAVVALPSVECWSRGSECVICKEEMEVGRDVCELPCAHRFHWGCVLGWLRKRNTCPCCRFELPTEDVFFEIGRMWRMLLRMNGKR